MTKQIKVYAGDDTLQKWQHICQRFTNNSAAFAAVVESYFNQNQEAMMDTKSTMTVTICDAGWTETWGDDFNMDALCAHIQAELKDMEHDVTVTYGPTNGLKNICHGSVMNDGVEVIGMTDEQLTELVDDIIDQADMEAFV